MSFASPSTVPSTPTPRPNLAWRLRGRPPLPDAAVPHHMSLQLHRVGEIATVSRSSCCSSHSAPSLDPPEP
uniref:Uncharacterized protein n=1 Tax=Setaria viridis TaxID=4556 RepID=A0A4U6VWB9_SETVI|nr:hypothetical protein SEVIR_2G295550v2 [Setaria viridis]